MRQEVFRKTLATKCVKKEEVSEEEKKRMVAKKMRERRREEEGRKKEKKEENSVKLAQERNRMLRLFRKTMGESSKIREKVVSLNRFFIIKFHQGIGGNV